MVTFTPQRDAACMFRRRLQLLESYEVIGQPVVSSTGLAYIPWIDQAVRPYRATRLPSGVPTGLAGCADALRAATVLNGAA